jgi:glutamate synthase domain-containing protein 2
MHLATSSASVGIKVMAMHTSPISVANVKTGLVVVDGHKCGTGVGEGVSWDRRACAGSAFR